MNDFIELFVGQQIFEQIIKEVGEAPPIKGIYKSLYDEYCKVVLDDIKYVEDVEDGDKEMLDELEMEKLYIECFCRFLQEEANVSIKRKSVGVGVGVGCVSKAKEER